MSLYTRCPYCTTTFRITPEQLALRAGQVRCGACRAVFNAQANLQRQEEDPPLPEGMTQEMVTPLMPTLTAPTEEHAPPELENVRPREAPEPSDGRPVVVDDVDASAHESRFTWREERRPSARSRWVYGISSLFLLGFLSGHAAYHFRDLLAVRVPAMKPTLEKVCANLGCEIAAPRDSGSLSIESTELKEDPAHRGLLTLVVTLRNRSELPVAYPHIEFTLTDIHDQAIARRIFRPAEYLPAIEEKVTALEGDSEKTLRLRLDASAVEGNGYRVERFYP